MECCCPCILIFQPRRPPGKERVMLNVGGSKFTTSWETIRRVKGSHLEQMLLFKEKDGTYFVDRDGRHFHHILNFLRDGTFSVPDLLAKAETRREVMRESEFYGLSEVVEYLQTLGDQTPLVHGQLVQKPGGPRGVLQFVGAARPTNEEERLARLDGLNILHTAPNEPKFDNITSILAAICDMPIVLVSLVAENEQWFKSKCGLDAMSTDRSSSFCATMMVPEEPSEAFMLVIEDADKDSRVMRNPLVTGPPFIRFYAGSPLVTSDGIRLGSLCSIDRQPRTISAERCQIIVNMAIICVTEIEREQLREKSVGTQFSTWKSQDTEPLPNQGDGFRMPTFTHGPRRSDRMQTALNEGVLLCWVGSSSMDWPVLYANQTWTEISGLQVTSPKKFPHRAMVTAPDHEYEGHTVAMSDILWNWMRLISRQDAEVVKAIQDEMSDPPHSAQAFAISTVLRVPHKSSCVLNCKFTPAASPLDVNASAIQIPYGLPRRDEATVPSDWGPGCLYFVTIVARPIQLFKPQDELGDPFDFDCQLTGHSNNGVLSEPRLTPRGTTPEETPEDSPDVARLRRRNCGNTLEALNSMKPAKSPFHDVSLISPVGEGSFAKVYFGLWSGSSVAIKVIEQKEAKEEDRSFTPVFEATLSASITHPNLVQTYKFSSRQKEFTKSIETWIVQEWCDKGTITKYLREIAGTPLDLQEAMEDILEIVRAGCYLHTRGVIHGDLTGSNVLLKSDVCRKGHTCKVCDFGLARVLGETRAVMTNTLGTVTHVPPELLTPGADGGCLLTPKADVYAAGILMWQIMSRQLPFAGLLAPQVVVKVAHGTRPVMPPGVPQRIMDLYGTCVADADSRPTFDQLLDHIVGVIQSL